jgi:hypothetical protein
MRLRARNPRSEELSRYLREDLASLRGALGRTTALIGAFFDLLPFDLWAFEAFRVGMLRHVRLIERHVLPALAGARGAPLPVDGEVRIVHDALTTLLAGMPTLPLVGEIRGLLERHDRLDEELLAACDELPEAVSERLLGDLRAVPEPAIGIRYDVPGTDLTAEQALAMARRREAARRVVPIWPRT